MRKDPTEFRKRFADWKAGKKVYDGGLPKFEGGTEDIKTANNVPQDYAEIVNQKWLPTVDSVKASEAAYNVDDYAYRVLKLHPEITKQQVQDSYNKVPVIAGYGKTNSVAGGTYTSGANERVMIYPDVFGGDKNKIASVLGHETNHQYVQNILGGKHTEQEEDLLWEAYRPGFVFDAKGGKLFNEARATNAEIRKAISVRNKNAIGKDLDAAIDNISGDELMDIYFNTNGYITGGQKHMQKDGKWDPLRILAVKDALKLVAFNKPQTQQANPNIMHAKCGLENFKMPKFEEGAEPDYQHSSDFISKYEGWSDTAYQKKGDVPTIGYGTTNPKWVNKGRITRDLGIQAMHEDLAANEPLLRKNIKDYDRLPDTAKTVLRDILYNVGQGNMFRKSPKFIDAMNAGNYEEAARQMDWDENKPGFGGAKVRNQARREMFLLDLKKNPVKPRSQLVQLMYNKPEFQPGFQYTPTILTDYSLTNRAGGKLNAWNGAGSPAYGGASVSIPSLYLVMEQNLFKPRK